MWAEFGLIFLIMALALSALQIGWTVLGWRQASPGLVVLATQLSTMVFVLTGLAFGLLIAAFLTDDFAVKYVSTHSSTHMPWYYKVAAAWGAHEGSLLLWAWMLTGWVAAVALKRGALHVVEHQRIVFVLVLISFSFLLFILLTSNPFERLTEAVEEGLGLNPLLQDFALIMHPPLLYMGYVGLAVSFALAVSQLWQAEARLSSLKWARAWVLMSWSFLTLGIALGSWWAYYELGWGGWWFWDPVENASLLPWLVATALIHTLLVAEKRGVLIGWTLLLAILAFAMSLVGAFLVRSGVLTSVHAFATDPTRGSYILIFLVVVIGSALALFSVQAPKIVKSKPLQFLSKESALLFNNVLLMVMTATILLGTLYPLILEALGLGQLSVGAPYFNRVILPLAVPLALLMGFGFFIRWKQDKVGRLLRELNGLVLLVGLAILLAALWLMPEFNGLALLGLGLACWVGLAAIYWALRHLVKTKNLAPRMLGASLAHAGFALFILGMTMSAIFGIEKDVRLAPGDSYQLESYRIHFHSVEQTAGANYLTSLARLSLWHDEKKLGELQPEKRIYIGHSMPMTEVAIDARLTRDIYVALGEPLGDSGAWSFRLQYKPLIRAIWLGAILMALGGFIALWSRRRASE